MTRLNTNPTTFVPFDVSHLRRATTAHLIGSAGAGMRSLAEVLTGRGWQITGSDIADTPHAAEQVPLHAGLVIHSDAIEPNNCELRRAKKLKIPTLRYPEFLSQLMADGFGIAVAGTHGKSTTTAMAAEILFHAGLDPTVVCGATPHGKKTGGHAGNEDLVLVEACEYRANFLHLRPQVSVVLNIEPDHFDSYPSEEDLYQAFVRFTEQTVGQVLVNVDCPTSRKLTAALGNRLQTLALDSDAQWQAWNLRSQRGLYRFDLVFEKTLLGEVSLQVAGRHNVLNAVAAAAVAHAVGAEPEYLIEGLTQFAGLQRRLETRAPLAGVQWIDDYAHHPTELAAALRTVREMAPKRRLWCVFQPHQASRTARLLDDFSQVLQNADRILIAEIFRARENPAVPGEVTAEDLARATRRRGAEVAACHTREEIAAELAAAIREAHLVAGDVILTVGAGNIGDLADDVGERL